MMNSNDVLLAEVLAEVDYRTERMLDAGRSVWVERARRAGKRIRGHRAEGRVSAQ
ncbi:hypothetical protein [Amycolatopsis sp. BJA-103]|uniref:hypothetical protein n=1 Tax=unclassified Amycolatopsis TaxID=2618356 RepID=UPI001304AC4E|nr:hypothetical protein [Amycolatopsis sp. BJA-103]